MVEDEEVVESGTRDDLALDRRFAPGGADESAQSWPEVLRGKAAASRIGRSPEMKPL